MKTGVGGWNEDGTRAWVLVTDTPDSSRKVGVLAWSGLPGGWVFHLYIEDTDQLLEPQQLPLERERIEALHREQIDLALGQDGPQKDALMAELNGRIDQLRKEAEEGAVFMARVKVKHHFSV